MNLESSPDLSTQTWKQISMNQSSKTKYLKEDMESSTKEPGDKPQSPSKCSKSNQKAQSRISSVNVEPWKSSDIPISLCSQEPVRNLPILPSFLNSVAEVLYGQPSKIWNFNFLGKIGEGLPFKLPKEFTIYTAVLHLLSIET